LFSQKADFNGQQDGRFQSLFRVNGVVYSSDAGTFDENARCVRGRAISVLKPNQVVDIRLKGVFPARQAEQANACESMSSGGKGQRESVSGWQDLPLFSMKVSPLIDSSGIERLARLKYGLNIEWVEPTRMLAEEKNHRDLISLLCFFLSGVKIEGKDEILECCEIIGQEAEFVKKRVANCGATAAYPFANAIVVPGDNLLVSMDSEPENSPDRFMFMPENGFVEVMVSASKGLKSVSARNFVVQEDNNSTLAMLSLNAGLADASGFS